MLVVLVGAVLIALSVLVNYLSRAKCPYCKSRKATEIKREKLYSEPVLFKEQVKMREYENKNASPFDYTYTNITNVPQKTITQEIVVQGERTWYEVMYECDDCHKSFSRKEYIDKKPRMVK